MMAPAVIARRSTGRGLKILLRCQCGIYFEQLATNFNRKKPFSCGCASKNSFVHGKSNDKTYRAWRGIKTRCLNRNFEHFKYYGGRGIKVCKRWRESFLCFLEDMGQAPAGSTIDRIDNNGHYEPNNCRWTSQKQNNRNRNFGKKFNFKGKEMRICEISELTGVRSSRLYSRTRRGWSIIEAVSAG